MTTNIKFTTALLGALSILLSGCSKQLEKKLLSTKSYFEETYVPLEVRDEVTLSYALTTRTSSPVTQETTISYHLGTAEDVEEYNKKNNTEYLPFAMENVAIPVATGKISAGGVSSSPVAVELKGLDKVEAGKTFLVPIHFDSDASAPAIPSAQTMFLALQKPVQIKSVGFFRQSRWGSGGNWISLPRLTDYTFESVTYEALIHPLEWRSNNTVMGVEGKLILRIGDEGGGLARNKIQIAGSKQFHYDSGLDAGKWYHVAFTFDHNTGKAIIYVNGKNVVSSDWDQIADIREGFAVGQVPHFMWGTRPFHGYMAEVRLWNVARSESEIQQNMLKVDPKTDGLVVYYHLNGEDINNRDGKWSITDATGHGLDGIPNDGNREFKAEVLKTPLEAKDIK